MGYLLDLSIFGSEDDLKELQQHKEQDPIWQMGMAQSKLNEV